MFTAWYTVTTEMTVVEVTVVAAEKRGTGTVLISPFVGVCTGQRQTRLVWIEVGKVVVVRLIAIPLGQV